MVSALDSGASALGSSPGLGHYVVFLGKTLYSHGASLHPGVQISCHGNRDNLRPDGPLGAYADLTYLTMSLWQCEHPDIMTQ